MIRVADYIFHTLADRGVRHVFMLTGGGAMHLNNAVAREPRIKPVCNHHEQACAMAAEAYAKAKGELAVVNVTTGPGGINALNGIFGAWTDSMPVLCISGQVKRELCMASQRIPGLRQLGEQEADILAMVAGITKYSAYVDDPLTIRYHLERAIHTAFAGRPGPCWLDIPLDVQAALVDESKLEGFVPQPEAPGIDGPGLEAACREIAARLKASKRPVLMYGSGVRISGTEPLLEHLVERLRIPVVPSRSAHDILPGGHPLICGYPGIDCDRAGNFTVQNADFLLVLGSRLGMRQIGYTPNEFGRNAWRAWVDIDAAEMQKPYFRPHLSVHADLRSFLPEFSRALDGAGNGTGEFASWLAWCRERVARYPVVLPRHREMNGRVNPYHFFEVLFESLAPEDCMVTANGTAFLLAVQMGRFVRGQRLLFNNGCMSMGWDLPAAIGAAFARSGRRVVCLAGDGSVQMNIQELQTICHHKLPIKIFVLNNNGYLSIRLTQGNFFGELVGESAASGVSFPDFARVAEAYGIPAITIDGAGFRDGIEKVLSAPGPALAAVDLDPDQAFEPKVASRRLPDGRMVSSPFEDMYPFLDRQELLENTCDEGVPEKARE